MSQNIPISLTEKLLQNKGKILVASTLISGIAASGGLAALGMGASAVLAPFYKEIAGTAIGKMAIRFWEKISSKKAITKEDIEEIKKSMKEIDSEIKEGSVSELRGMIKNLLKDEAFTMGLTIDMQKNIRDDIGQMKSEMRSDFEAIATRLDIIHQELVSIEENVGKCGIIELSNEIYNKIPFLDIDNDRKDFDEQYLMDIHWSTIIWDFDVRRNQHIDEISKNIENGKSVMIIGTSGSGKSTMLKRIAYEHFLKGYRVFWRVGDEINPEKAYDKLARTTGKKIVVLDNARSIWSSFRQLHQRCFEESRKDIVFLLAERAELFNEPLDRENILKYNLTLTSNDISDLLLKRNIKIQGELDKLLKKENEYLVMKHMIYSIPENTMIDSSQIASLNENAQRQIRTLASERFNSIPCKEECFPIMCLSAYNCPLPLGIYKNLEHHSIDKLYILNKQGFVYVEKGPSDQETNIYGCHPILAKEVLNCYADTNLYSFKDAIDDVIHCASEPHILYNIGTNIYLENLKDMKMLEIAKDCYTSCINQIISSEPDDWRSLAAMTWTSKAEVFYAMGNRKEFERCDKNMMICLSPSISIHDLWITTMDSTDPGMTSFIKARTCEKTDEAIKLFDRAIIATSNTLFKTMMYNEKGVLSANAGKFEDAIKCYDEAIKISPYRSTTVMLWRSKGSIFGMMGRHEEAIECFNEAIKNETNSKKTLESLFLRAISLSSLNIGDEAMNTFNMIIEIDPKSDFARKAQGIKDAMTRLDGPSRTGDKDMPSLTEKGLYYFSMGRYKEAHECFDEILKMDPNSISAWLGKGVTYLQEMMMDEAGKCFDEVLRIDPTHTEALNAKKLIHDS